MNAISPQKTLSWGICFHPERTILYGRGRNDLLSSYCAPGNLFKKQVFKTSQLLLRATSEEQKSRVQKREMTSPRLCRTPLALQGANSSAIQIHSNSHGGCDHASVTPADRALPEVAGLPHPSTQLCFPRQHWPPSDRTQGCVSVLSVLSARSDLFVPTSLTPGTAPEINRNVRYVHEAGVERQNR